MQSLGSCNLANRSCPGRESCDIVSDAPLVNISHLCHIVHVAQTMHLETLQGLHVTDASCPVLNYRPNAPLVIISHLRRTCSPAAMHLQTLQGLHLRMVCPRRQPLLCQTPRQGLRLFACRTVHNACTYAPSHIITCHTVGSGK